MVQDEEFAACATSSWNAMLTRLPVGTAEWGVMTSDPAVEYVGYRVGLRTARRLP